MSDASVLIVEDEGIVALDLSVQLEEMGYKVVGTAESGEEALRLAHAHRPTLRRERASSALISTT